MNGLLISVESLEGRMPRSWLPGTMHAGGCKKQETQTHTDLDDLGEWEEYKSLEEYEN